MNSEGGTISSSSSLIQITVRENGQTETRIIEAAVSQFSRNNSISRLNENNTEETNKFTQMIKNEDNKTRTLDLNDFFRSW